MRFCRAAVALAVLCGCATELPVADHSADGLSVHAFAVGVPTVQIAYPPAKPYASCLKPGAAMVVSLAVKNITLAKGAASVVCYIDDVNAFTYYGGAPPTLKAPTAPGLHTLVCQLFDDSGTWPAQLLNFASRARRYFTVCKSCTADKDCVTANNCATSKCLGGQCYFSPKGLCCNHNLDCSPGQLCALTGTSNAKCTACKVDVECIDGLSCTTDKCVGGSCVNTKYCEECTTAWQCNDLQPCTLDACEQVGQHKICTHKTAPGACCSNADCKTPGQCLIRACDEAECRAVGPDPQRPDCCSEHHNSKCDDGVMCTSDKCGTPQPGGWTKCVHELDKAKLPKASPTCCQGQDSVCNDNNPCTLDRCDKLTCRHTEVANCCFQDVECDDNNVCTVDTCSKDPAAIAAAAKDGVPAAKVGGKCTPKQVVACCNKAADCDDGKTCTAESCWQHACQNTKIGCCSDADCDDNDPKTTIDICINTACVHGPFGDKKPTTGCVIDNDCDDGIAYSADICTQGECTHKVAEGHCWDDLDALAKCDDGHPCTVDYCANHRCRHTPPKAGCCTKNTETLDCPNNTCGDAGTCKDIVAGVGKCAYTASPGAKCSAESPQACDDNNPCTEDRCDCGKCLHQPIAGCCSKAAGCFDGDPCTADFCVHNTCLNADIPGCCRPATAATDCFFAGKADAPGKCVAAPDGTWHCAP